MQLSTQKLMVNTETSVFRLPGTIILITLSILLLVLKLETYPAPWFDEGYSMNNAMTLVDTGIYGIRSGDLITPFDPGTSTGSTVILPIAVVYKLVGPGVLPARLVITIYAIVGLFALLNLSRLIYPAQAALICMLLLVAVPLPGATDYISLGRQVMGEIPAFALVMLGLWLWVRRWDDASSWRAGLVGGLLIGVGLIAKLQMSLAVLPALGLVSLGRFVFKRQGLSVFVTVIASVAVIVSWMIVQRMLTTPEQQAYNSGLLSQAISILFFIGLTGRPLPSTAYYAILIMLIALVATGFRIAQRIRGAQTHTTEHWVEAFLMILVLCSLVWYTLMSSGWPRYAFIGATCAVFLIGRTVADLLTRVEMSIGRRLYAPAVIALVLAALVFKAVPVIRDTNSQKAELAAAYIHNNIAPDARIETFEWYLDAMAPNNTFEHPTTGQQYVTLRASIAGQQPPFADFSEEVIASNPDYLVVGPFGGWTGVYPPELLETYFTELVHIGEFTIYERRP